MLLHEWRLGAAIVLAAWSFHARAADFDPSRSYRDQIHVQRSEFDAHPLYVGPDLRASTGRGGGDEELFVALMATRPTDGKPPAWEIVLQAAYPPPWRVYQSVSLVGGAVIQGEVVRRGNLGCHRGHCLIGEALSFPLPAAIVAKGVAAGLRVRFNAERTGSFEFELPAAYFAAMQQALKN